MIAWILYLAAISAALVGAALAAEMALRRLRLPTRWTWFGAIVGSLVLPALVPALRGLVARPKSGQAGLVTVEPLVFIGTAVLEPVTAAGSRFPHAPALDPFILAAWIAGSLSIAAVLVASALRLWLRSRRWNPTVVDRTPVLVSADTGPAVLGLLGSRIVLPEWALELPERSRSLLVRHELEHQRAGDVPLLNAALATFAVCPWNPFLWFAVRRLRLAIEVDCDARVLRTTRDLATYGELLLAVGGRIDGSPLLAATAAVESRSTLEHRIRVMTASRSRMARLTAIPLGAAAVTLAAVACEMREPMRSTGAVPESDRSVAVAQLALEPAFTPRTVEPRLLDDQREILANFLSEHGPRVVPATAERTRTVLWAFIGEDGMVGATRVVVASGIPEFDEVAAQSLLAVQFRPAENHGEAVPVWVQVPIAFQADIPEVDEVNSRPSAPATPPSEPAATMRDVEAIRAALQELMQKAFEMDGVNARDAREAAQDITFPDARSDIRSGPPLAEQPAFTPRTVEPRLSSGHRSALHQYLERNYPPALREAGISGRVVLWVFVDEQGSVLNTRVVEPSGYAQFDNVAQQALRTVRFTPALNRDQPVPVWVQLPIQYNFRPPVDDRP